MHRLRNRKLNANGAKTEYFTVKRKPIKANEH